MMDNAIQIGVVVWSRKMPDEDGPYWAFSGRGEPFIAEVCTRVAFGPVPGKPVSKAVYIIGCEMDTDERGWLWGPRIVAPPAPSQEAFAELARQPKRPL